MPEKRKTAAAGLKASPTKTTFVGGTRLKPIAQVTVGDWVEYMRVSEGGAYTSPGNYGKVTRTRINRDGIPELHVTDPGNFGWVEIGQWVPRSMARHHIRGFYEDHRSRPEYLRFGE